MRRTNAIRRTTTLRERRGQTKLVHIHIRLVAPAAGRGDPSILVHDDGDSDLPLKTAPKHDRRWIILVQIVQLKIEVTQTLMRRRPSLVRQTPPPSDDTETP